MVRVLDKSSVLTASVCIAQAMLALEKKSGLALMVSPAGPRSLSTTSVHAGAPREVIPWSELKPESADKYFSALVMPALRGLKAIAGSARDNDVLIARAIATRSERKGFRSQSVPDEACIFSDPLAIMQMAGLELEVEKLVKWKIKNGQSAYDFMVFLENEGIGTRAAAALRKDKPGLFWGSGKVTDERAE